MQWRNNLSLCTPAIPCIRAAVARIGNDAEPVICMNFAFQDSKQIRAFCVAFAVHIRNNSVSLLRPVKLICQIVADTGLYLPYAVVQYTDLRIHSYVQCRI